MTLPLDGLIVHYTLAHPHARALLADAQALGVTALTQLEVADLYFIEGALTPTDKARLAAELLSDSITQIAQWRRLCMAHTCWVSQACNMWRRRATCDAR